MQKINSFMGDKCICTSCETGDVEQEDFVGDGNADTITEPFNPNSIDVDIATVNLGMLIDQLGNEEIELNPEFQRASDIWSPTKKSRLIESILLGLPLPSFYFSEDRYSQKLSVIDGLQRLCAIKDFVIYKKLKLQDLQFLHSFEGKGYDDLDRPEIRRINSLKITMNTLRKSTPNEVKFVIFQRVNTAGEPLKPQEMRHALNQGPAAVMIKNMAEMESFKRATNFSVPSKRMQDRDFANRFVAFYLGYQEYSGELDNFMNSQMGQLNVMSTDERAAVCEAFNKAMTCCYSIFKDDTFRKRMDMNDRRKPISKAVFDALSVNVAWLTDSERDDLINSASLVREKFMSLCRDDKFMMAVSTGTGKKYSVNVRFAMVKEMLYKILHKK